MEMNAINVASVPYSSKKLLTQGIKMVSPVLLGLAQASLVPGGRFGLPDLPPDQRQKLS